MTHDAARALIDTQFTTGLDAAQRAQMRDHVRRCSACKRYYDRLAELDDALGKDAAIEARLHALGAPEPARPLPARRGWGVGLALAAGLVLAAGAVVFLRPSTTEFGVKSGGGVVKSAIRLFRKPASGPVAPVTKRIERGDGLLVSYTNPKNGSTHLGVVARDAAGRLLWIQPAWTDSAERPKARRIERGVADRELPQVVHHDLTPGTVEICAMFVQTPRSIAEWDAQLSAQWPPTDALCRSVVVR